MGKQGGAEVKNPWKWKNVVEMKGGYISYCTFFVCLGLLIGVMYLSSESMPYVELLDHRPAASNSTTLISATKGLENDTISAQLHRLPPSYTNNTSNSESMPYVELLDHRPAASNSTTLISATKGLENDTISAQLHRLPPSYTNSTSNNESMPYVELLDHRPAASNSTALISATKGLENDTISARLHRLPPSYTNSTSKAGYLGRVKSEQVIRHHVPRDRLHAHKCDMFNGNWVFDNKSYPLYRDWNCSFMIEDLACEKFHRRDLNYQYWRWQPNQCDLPKFDAKALLEVLRNKRLIFVGDSLDRNQWVSMMCLIESAIPSGLKSRVHKGNLYSFRAKEYNATVDFYWSPLLLESNSDDPSNHHLSERIVKIDSIEKHAKFWSNADILVFNSYLWWHSVPKLKIWRKGSTIEKAKDKESKQCYKMALKTWSKFILGHLNINHTRLFWVSMSPTHSRPENWGRPEDYRKCMNETMPTVEKTKRGSETDPKMMSITKSAIIKLKRRGVKIDLLDITRLSDYRKDAHPTIYRRLWRPLTKDQIDHPWTYADCTHWCLPGVPDVWNQILFAYLITD